MRLLYTVLRKLVYYRIIVLAFVVRFIIISIFKAYTNSNNNTVFSDI